MKTLRMLCVAGWVGLLWVGLLASPGFGQEPDRSLQSEYRVIPLEHSYVADVAETLTELLTHEDGFVIVPDTQTNALFVQGSHQQLQVIESLVIPLDKAPPTIDVDVLILKLDLADAGDGQPVELSGDTEQVKATVARLEQAGLAEVIERLHLTTLDNQIAQVEFGAQQPAVRGRTFPGSRNATRDRGTPIVSLENVGTLVTAVPRLSANAVLMELSVEKSWIQEEEASDEGQEDNAADVPETATETQNVSVRATVRIPDGRAVIMGDREIASEGQRSRLAVIVTASVRR